MDNGSLQFLCNLGAVQHESPRSLRLPERSSFFIAGMYLGNRLVCPNGIGDPVQ